jgi:hypothetical protein
MLPTSRGVSAFTSTLKRKPTIPLNFNVMMFFLQPTSISTYKHIRDYFLGQLCTVESILGEAKHIILDSAYFQLIKKRRKMSEPGFEPPANRFEVPTGPVLAVRQF